MAIIVTGFTSGMKHGFEIQRTDSGTAVGLSWCYTREQARQEAVALLRRLADELELRHAQSVARSA